MHSMREPALGHVGLSQLTQEMPEPFGFLPIGLGQCSDQLFQLVILHRGTSMKANAVGLGSSNR